MSETAEMSETVSQPPAMAPPTVAAPGAPETVAVPRGVRRILRAEGAVAFLAAVAAYAEVDWGWGRFALLFLVPDLSMLGYLAGPRLGAIAYNAAHTYLVPGALAAYGLWAGSDAVFACALIWIAHIGFDRLLGYGLKLDGGFGFTHLGMIGRARR